MNIGPRTHKRASLRIATPTGLPEEMRSDVREIVSVVSEDRGKGHAKALMHTVCAEADRAWMTLLIKVEPFAEGMDADQLKRFYAKHGFVEIQAEPCLMVRSPQKGLVRTQTRARSQDGASLVTPIVPFARADCT